MGKVKGKNQSLERDINIYIWMKFRRKIFIMSGCVYRFDINDYVFVLNNVYIDVYDNVERLIFF